MAMQPPPSYQSVTVPQVVYTSGPTQHSQQQHRHLSQIKTTAILHLVGGTLLVLLGIVAIILWAYWSFFATPIWSGIVIYGLTGCIGMCASGSKKRSMTGGYIIMSIIAAAMSGALVVMYSIAAADEGYYSYYYGALCRPGNYWIYYCYKSLAARITFDCLIAVTALFELIVSLVSCSYGCCFTCTGCNSCCKSCCGKGCANCCSSCCVGQCCSSQVSPGTAVFTNGAMIATTPHGLQQSGGVTLQSGLQTTGQLAGMYIVQQAPGQAYPQAGQTAPAQQLAYPPQAYVTTSPGQQGAAPTQFVPVPIPNQQIATIQNVHVVGATAQSMQAQSNYPGPSIVQMTVAQPLPQATNFPHSNVSK